MNKKRTLGKITVVHSLPGRLRVEILALKYLVMEKKDIIQTILASDDVIDVGFSHISGRMLVQYIPSTNEEDIILFLEQVIGSYALLAYQKEREAFNNLPVKERRIHEESVVKFLRRIGLTVGALFYYYLKGYQKKALVSSNKKFLTNPSILSLVLSIDIIKSGLKSLREDRKPNADTLTTSAILVAILTGRSLSALMTILLSDIAELMTAYTMDRTRKAIKDMLTNDDETIFKVKEDGSLVEIPLAMVEVDDIISIQTGEKINVDGKIILGNAYIDQSAITGEYFPVSRKSDDHVYAGTLVKSGQIHVKAEKIGDETTVSRIVHLIEDASVRKAQIQTYADKFSAQLIPLNFALSALVYLTTRSVTRALSMLIIDYSCGVRLSTATALSASIHNAARNGVLIKGGNYIEELATADSLVLDKTGTMTEGKPRIVSLIPLGRSTENSLLSYAAAAEEDSQHPLAHAIISESKSRNIKIPNHGLTEIVMGRGIETTVKNQIVRVGNYKFMQENNVSTDQIGDLISPLERRGELIVYVSLDTRLVGIIGIHDALKDNMKKSLNRLRFLGFDDIRLLTGDVNLQAEKMAVRMNMDDYASDLLPEDKALTVLQMQANGSRVMMVGDGINDAPALAYSNVGIAIGNTRTDIAIESADITITNDDPLLIPSTVNLSRKTMGIIKQNFAAVIGINTIGILLSAIGYLPVFWSSVLHNSSTILVVLNSGRLLVHDFERR